MIAYKIIITKKANADEFGIYDYILNKFGKLYAENFRRNLIQTFNMLPKYPFIGRVAKNNPALRVYILNKQNKLVYKVTENEIVIIRLLNQKTNLSSKY